MEGKKNKGKQAHPMGQNKHLILFQHCLLKEDDTWAVDM